MKAAAGLACAVSLWLGVAPVVLAQWDAAVAPATASVARVPVSIPAQPLLAALRAFGLQTQSQVLFAGDVPDAVQRSQAIHGLYSPHEALVLMLAPTGVEIAAVRPGSFALRAAAAPAAADVREWPPGLRSVALVP